MTHSLLSVLSYLVIIYILHFHKFSQSVESSEKKQRGWVIWLSFVFVAIHLVRELHLGNINLPLLLLFCLGWFYFDTDRKIASAICFSLLILFKPFFIILTIPLFRRHLKFISSMIIIGLSIIILSTVLSGITNSINLWAQWLDAVLMHSEYQVNHEAISSLISFYLGYTTNWAPTIILLALLVILILFDQLRSKKLRDIEWVVVLLALTPTLFKTDTQHFMFSLPLFYLLVKHLLQFRKKMMWLIFTLLMMGFSLNSNDLLGKQLGQWVTQCGFLGLSNLGFVLLFLATKYTYDLKQDESIRKSVC